MSGFSNLTYTSARIRSSLFPRNNSATFARYYVFSQIPIDGQITCYEYRHAGGLQVFRHREPIQHVKGGIQILFVFQFRIPIGINLVRGMILIHACVISTICQLCSDLQIMVIRLYCRLQRQKI